ncbi:hypothetical protein C8Q74DRAFT_1165543, partial [Fomes fomentarius]
ARVDPHLTAGCEVVLDVQLSLLEPLERVQTTFLRRAQVGLGPRSQLAPLYTETGVWPLHYRRVLLTLRYLDYVLRARP